MTARSHLQWGKGDNASLWETQNVTIRKSKTPQQTGMKYFMNIYVGEISKWAKNDCN